MMKMIKISMVFLASILSSAVFAGTFVEHTTSVGSQASGAAHHAFYLGVQDGYADMNYSGWVGVSDQGDIAMSEREDDTGLAARVFGGYQFNPYISVEMGFLWLPKVSVKVTAHNEYISCTSEMNFQQYALDLMLKGTLPLPNHFNLFAKVGSAHVWRSNVKLAGLDGKVHTVDSVIDDKVTFAGSVGAGYYFNQNIFADISYSVYLKNDDLPRTDFYALGIGYQF